jgi:hypothetical protein
MLGFIIMGQGSNHRFKVAAYVCFAFVVVADSINLSLLAVSTYYLNQGSIFFGNVAASMRRQDFISDIVICFLSETCQELQIYADFKSAVDNVNQALRFQSYASVCEGLSLLTILISCSIAGVHCMHRFSKTNTNLNSSIGRKNNTVRIQIIVTVSTVFVAFLIRSFYAVILSLSRFNNEIALPELLKTNEPCPNLCSSCQKVGVIVQAWLWLTPELSVPLMLLSSPLTMLIGLWGMTSPGLLQKLRQDQHVDGHSVPLAPSMRGLLGSNMFDQ